MQDEVKCAALCSLKGKFMFSRDLSCTTDPAKLNVCAFTPPEGPVLVPRVQFRGQSVTVAAACPYHSCQGHATLAGLRRSPQDLFRSEEGSPASRSFWTLPCKRRKFLFFQRLPFTLANYNRCGGAARSLLQERQWQRLKQKQEVSREGKTQLVGCRDAKKLTHN